MAEETTYYAHTTPSADRHDWHLLADHLRETGAKAAARGAPLGLAASAGLAGLLHDFGKYDPRFQQRLNGETIEVDHSTAGGALLLQRVPDHLRPCAELLAYAILGHHAGLPDMSGSKAALGMRIEAHENQIPANILAAEAPDFAPVLRELVALASGGRTPAFDLSVAARMVFSCLVDADFRDTEAFYAKIEGRTIERDWPPLASLLPAWIELFDAHMAAFGASTPIDRLRNEILAHVRKNAAMKPGLFTLSVPTGGGKTLTSLGFALDHARLHGHRRIIYAIPYTSIIDQTAAIFRGLFGDMVLEHHAAIDAEEVGSEARDKLRLAMEDWAAPLVVTTNVQLFESLFAARPSRCRKLHNIAGSVIILDEAQTLPRKLLRPSLAMLDVLARHYGCSIVLCTATQPAFDSQQLKNGGLPLTGRELAPDPPGLARRLRRARIVDGGAMADDALIAALAETAQGLVIVNSRAHALDLYRAGVEAGLAGLLHLTTRQYPAHRRRILADIRARLDRRELCRLIATSLVEAGVDLDFPRGWRAEAGLDSCVQAAGRVNRNGRFAPEDSILTIFSAPGRAAPAEVRNLAAAMRKTARKFDDLLVPEAIRDWFEEVYWRAGADRLGEDLVRRFLFGGNHTDFPFRATAEDYRMIETLMVPIIIPGDEEARKTIALLAAPALPSRLLARRVQPYTVQIPAKARDRLLRNGHARFEATHVRADQFCVLQTMSLYHEDSGLWWEDAEYLGIESLQI